MPIPRWLLFSFLSAIGYALGSVFTYKLTDGGKLNATSVAASYHIVGVFLFLLLMLIPLPFGLSKNNWRDFGRLLKESMPLVILISILFLSGDLCLTKAYQSTPNPGYCDGISNLSILFTVILPVIFYSAKLTMKNFIGIILAIFSVYLLKAT